ncbi:hypothetical protein J6590_006963 [Homalodisca vitripennis]|nr:hypothetical protein J6590_006963 [Homalodisca vitripennis]
MLIPAQRASRTLVMWVAEPLPNTRGGRYCQPDSWPGESSTFSFLGVVAHSNGLDSIKVLSRTENFLIISVPLYTTINTENRRRVKRSNGVVLSNQMNAALPNCPPTGQSLT